MSLCRRRRAPAAGLIVAFGGFPTLAIAGAAVSALALAAVHRTAHGRVRSRRDQVDQRHQVLEDAVLALRSSPRPCPPDQV